MKYARPPPERTEGKERAHSGWEPTRLLARLLFCATTRFLRFFLLHEALAFCHVTVPLSSSDLPTSSDGLLLGFLAGLLGLFLRLPVPLDVLHEAAAFALGYDRHPPSFTRRASPEKPRPACAAWTGKPYSAALSFSPLAAGALSASAPLASIVLRSTVGVAGPLVTPFV